MPSCSTGQHLVRHYLVSYLSILTFLEIEFPRDDQLEQQLKAAQDVHFNISNHINAESQAVSLLKQADGYMGACEHHMTQALSYSTWGELIYPII